MRIQVNNSKMLNNRSPKQIGDEVRQLFKDNPNGNPFQIMNDKVKVETSDDAH